MSRPKGLEKEIESLAQDNLSGATALTVRGANILASLVKISEARTLGGFHREFLSTARAIIQAQPSMAPLRNLVNTLLWGVNESDSLDQVKEGLLYRIQNFTTDFDSKPQAIARYTLSLFGRGSIILTHSFSSTVLTALLLAKRKRKRFSVICSESRPLGEGKNLARLLAEEGIQTRLALDAALAETVEEATLVLVGGDAVIPSPLRLVNKIGTYGLALAAQAQQVPFYALVSSDKFLPPGSPPLSNPPHNPGEVWPQIPRIPKLQVVNRYFDFTPLQLLTGLVTEQGVFSPRQTKRYIPRAPLHPDLLGII